METERARARRLVGLIALVAVLVLVLAAGVGVGAYRLGDQTGTAELDGELAAVAELFGLLRTQALDAPGEETLVRGALEGMLDTLEDPHAVYYDPASFGDFSELLDGTFSGIGVMIEQSAEGVIIVNVLPGTPAAEAGLRAGEQIVSVDGRDVADAPIDAVVRLVRGEEGSTVRLGLEGGPAGPREVDVTRATIDLPVVQSELLDDAIGHVRVLQFSEGASGRVRAAIEDLREQGARGIVFDLRGNPGGLLREAVRVASVFIEEGAIVQVQERSGEVEVLEARGGALDVPAVLLVDGGSASASEIVAAAFQHHERGLLVGQTTFGKGTVQAVRQLSDGSGVKYTTAQYLTAAGESIEGVGVTPDREVGEDEDLLAAAEAALRAQLAEANAR